MEAKKLAVGDVLTTSDGKELAIEKIEVKQEHATVYNFKVKDFHTYFVSNLGIWTHNACGVAPHVVVNALSNFQSSPMKFGSNTFLLDKSGMKHILERHHPNYWDGSVKAQQTFFDASMSIEDITSAIKSVIPK